MSPRQVIPRPEGWQPVDSPRWRSDLELDHLLARPPVVGLGDASLAPVATPAGWRASAVLIALTDAIAGGVHVLVTRRSATLRAHAGEVSFPGGRLDPGETAVEAAVREAFEEVALPPALVDVRGQMVHHNTFVSANSIVPVVAVVDDPPPLRPNPGEVDAAYWVPVERLTEVHHRELWRHDEIAFPIEFFELDDDVIWGATARMLVTLLSAPS